MATSLVPNLTVIENIHEDVRIIIRPFCGGSNAMSATNSPLWEMNIAFQTELFRREPCEVVFYRRGILVWQAIMTKSAMERVTNYHQEVGCVTTTIGGKEFVLREGLDEASLFYYKEFFVRTTREIPSPYPCGAGVVYVVMADGRKLFPGQY